MYELDRIKQLKKERNAIILAHNYQRAEVQDAADFVGDSFGLSQKAVTSGAEVIVFAELISWQRARLCSTPEKRF